MTQQKFLVHFVQTLSHRQIFFCIWLATALLFSFLMMAFYRKATRRNFREDQSYRFPTRVSGMNTNRSNLPAPVAKPKSDSQET